MPHYSKSYNYYINILVLTTDDYHDFIVVMSTRQHTRPNYKCLHDLILLINSMSGVIP